MFRRDFVLSVLATPLLRWFHPTGSTRVAGLAVDPANAANLYEKAFGWALAVRPEDWERLNQASTIAIDHNVARLIDGAQLALRAIREASWIPLCRWEPAEITQSDLGKGRLDIMNAKVIKVACLSARRFASQGRGLEALDDLFAALVLAHRIGAGGVIFSRVLECSDEFTVFQTLGRLLPSLDRATLADLSRRLETLPPPEPASVTIEHESRYIGHFIRTKLATLGPIIEGDQWKELEINSEAITALKRLTRGDRTRLLDHLEATAPAYAELGRRLDLPRPEFRAAIDEFARLEAPTQPIVVELVESSLGIRHVVDRMLGYRAMLRAGLALVRDGEGAFRAERDPFGPGSFVLERRGDGFLIRSALVDEGRPELSLPIGNSD